METDGSNPGMAGMLSQYHVITQYKQVDIVQYRAKTLSTTQHNWLMHNKELFSVVDCLHKWKDWLVELLVNVFIDHQKLLCLYAKQKLNLQQAS